MTRPVTAATLAGILDEAIPDQNGPGCALGVVASDGTLTTTCRGLANLEYGVQIQADTVFHVASLSKQFTAYAAQLLADAGAFGLDDVVQTHLPWLPFADITVEQLIRHTSGLRDQWELVEASGGRMEDVITTDDLVALIAAQRGLNFAPGTRHEYSNTNYTVLAALIEQVDGRSLATFCSDRIFEPIEMGHTRFVADHHEVVPGRADSYQTDTGEEHRRIALSYSAAGATGLNSTVPDLLRWLTFAARPDTHRMRTRRRPLPDAGSETYGLGVRVGLRNGHDLVYHAGADAGYRCHFLAVPALGVATVALANSAAVRPADLCAKALDLVLDDGPKPSSRTADGPRLDAAGGRFVDADSGWVLDLRATTNTIELDTSDGALRLDRVGPRVLATPGGDLTIEVTDAGRLQANVDPATGPRTWLPLPSDDEPASPSVDHYVGTFVSDELSAQLRIVISATGLRLVRPRRRSAPLRRISDRVFTADLPDAYEARRVVIAFAANGDSLSYTTPQARDVEFFRATLAAEPAPRVRDLLVRAVAERRTER